jgi:hypothetical protein
MEAYRVPRLIHLEGDIMLYADAARTAPAASPGAGHRAVGGLDQALQSQFGPGLAATPLKENTFTASIFYVGSAAALDQLNGLLVNTFVSANTALQQVSGLLV